MRAPNKIFVRAHTICFVLSISAAENKPSSGILLETMRRTGCRISCGQSGWHLLCVFAISFSTALSIFYFFQTVNSPHYYTEKLHHVGDPNGMNQSTGKKSKLFKKPNFRRDL